MARGRGAPKAPRNPFRMGRGGVIRWGPPAQRTRSRSRDAAPPEGPVPPTAAQASAAPAGPVPGPGPRASQRADAPPVLPYRRGDRAAALAVASDPVALRAAVQSLDGAAFAATSAAPRASRAALWADVLRAAGFSADDLSVPAVQAGIAALRAAGYRSAMAVADQVICDARERGFAPGPALRRTIDKARRACRRGLGPVRHTAPLPLERVPELPGGCDPWVLGGPVHPRRYLAVGSWWLTREIELSNALLRDVRVIGPGEIALTLPASKTDIAALGTARSHKCACGRWGSGPALLDPLLCPACNLREQMLWAGGRHGAPAEHGLLFPSGEGTVVPKKAAAATIRHAAGLLGLPLVGPSGAELWGGHALRRGGVQYLGRSGVEVWRIQALARHSSSAILGYLEGAHISTLNTVAAEAATGRTLDAVRREIKALQAEVAAGRRPPDAIAAALADPGASASSLALPLSSDQVLEAPAPPRVVERPAAPYIVSTYAHGRLHDRHPAIAGLTRCGWAWQRHASACEVHEAFAAPRCRRCFPPRSGSASGSSTSGSSGGSSSSPSSPSRAIE